MSVDPGSLWKFLNAGEQKTLSIPLAAGVLRYRMQYAKGAETSCSGVHISKVPETSGSTGHGHRSSDTLYYANNYYQHNNYNVRTVN